MAGVSRFAHLAGIGRKKAAKAEDDKDDDKKEGASAEDKDDDTDEDEDKEKASAAGGDDGRDDDEDDDGEDEKKSKKGKAASGDDERCEDDEDDNKKEAKAVSRGRRMERARWSTVLSSKAASRNIEMAVMLLADSSKSAEHIVGRLTASTSTSSSADRRNRNPQIDATGPSSGGGDKVAASWEIAMKRAVGGRR